MCLRASRPLIRRWWADFCLLCPSLPKIGSIRRAATIQQRLGMGLYSELDPSNQLFIYGVRCCSNPQYYEELHNTVHFNLAYKRATLNWIKSAVINYGYFQRGITVEGKHRYKSPLFHHRVIDFYPFWYRPNCDIEVKHSHDQCWLSLVITPFFCHYILHCYIET